ncbi:hypothetical protein A7456_09450 [Moraxella nonliquefaciens]|uniref:Uncharacterized protein n=1 Tax=Moraxella nonliquefaciens TaxID=478 RepID=A0A1B8QQG6_MORNO|nr:hypothetical protein [Moraxella nonliquefaciens]OBX86541.1 hypothetical protein A7456_09450 [Moraxella nonliquefaciens]
MDTPNKNEHRLKYNKVHPKTVKNTPYLNKPYTLSRTKDLQNRLTEATERIHAQEKQIFELLATIKDLSQSVKLLEAPKRKKFLGIF